MRAFPLIKDLVTDVSWNFEVKKGIQRFRPRTPDAADGSMQVSRAPVPAMPPELAQVIEEQKS